MINGKSLGLALCRRCHSVQRPDSNRCAHCNGILYTRRPLSVQRSLALTLLATLLYIPANVLPIMSVVELGRASEDTIISGIVTLIESNLLPIALVVFLFSIVVPVLKLIGLYFLIANATKPLTAEKARQCTALYRLLEWVGRWSILDIFVIAVLVSLIHFSHFGLIDVKLGAVAFAAVVITTMLATMQLDPRLFWDQIKND